MGGRVNVIVTAQLATPDKAEELKKKAPLAHQRGSEDGASG
jgi:hypothetical protein